MIIAFVSASCAHGASAQADYIGPGQKVRWYKAPRGQGAEETVDPASAYKKQAIADVSANYLRLVSERNRQDFGSRDFFVIMTIAPNGHLNETRIVNVDPERPIEPWTRLAIQQAIRQTKFEKLGD